MMAASVLAGNFLAHLAPKWFIVAGLVGTGLLIMPLGYLPDYWWLVLDLLIVGVCIAPVNTGASTLMQVVIPNEQMGRVSGGINTVTETATLTSMGLAGLFGAAIGIPLVFVISGILVTGAGILGWALLPAITLKDAPRETETPLPQAASPLTPDQIINIEPVRDDDPNLVTTA
jgi:MFS family permease